MVNKKINFIVLIFLVAGIFAYAQDADEMADQKQGMLLKEWEKVQKMPDGEKKDTAMGGLLGFWENERKDSSVTVSKLQGKIDTLYSDAGIDNGIKFGSAGSSFTWLGILAIVVLVFFFFKIRKNGIGGILGMNVSDVFTRLFRAVTYRAESMIRKFKKMELNLTDLRNEIISNKEKAIENLEEIDKLKKDYPVDKYAFLQKDYKNQAGRIRGRLDLLEDWENKAKKLIGGFFRVENILYEMKKIDESIKSQKQILDKYEEKHFSKEINEKIKEYGEILDSEEEILREEIDLLKVKMAISTAHEINTSYKGFIKSTIEPQLKEIENEKDALKQIDKGLKKGKESIITEGMSKAHDSAKKILEFTNSEIKLYDDIIHLTEELGEKASEIKSKQNEGEPYAETFIKTLKRLEILGKKSSEALIAEIVEALKKKDDNAFAIAMSGLFSKYANSESRVRITLVEYGLNEKDAEEYLRAYFRISKRA